MTPFAFPSLNDQISQIRRTYPSLLRSIQFHIPNIAKIINHFGHIEQFWPLRHFGHFGSIWTLWASLGHFGPFGSLAAILRNLHFHLIYHLFGIVVFRMTNDQVLIKVKHHLKGSGFTKDCFMVLSQKQSKVTI